MIQNVEKFIENTIPIMDYKGVKRYCISGVVSLCMSML